MLQEILENINNSFDSYGWMLINNNNNNTHKQVYIKKQNMNNPFDEFIIDLNELIIVSPLRNSLYSCRTSFDKYADIVDYIQTHLENYERK
jgi:hypothetical protein